jgi:hypothetical protein
MKELKGKLISIKYRDRKDLISGFLIDFNDNWTLIKHNSGDYIIDGYMLLKTNKILRYKRDEIEEFHEKVLILKNLQPTEKDIFPLTNIYETLQLVSDRFGAFQIEIKDETVCYIGKLVKTTKENIVIKEISTKGRWVETESYKLKSIRCILFDNDYVNSLILYNKAIESE